MAGEREATRSGTLPRAETGGDAGIGVAVWSSRHPQAHAGYMQVPSELRELWASQQTSSMDPLYNDIFEIEGVDKELAEEALKIAYRHLAPGGRMVAKLFQGPEAQSFMAEAKECFLRTVLFKPAASRSESREIFVVGDDFKAG